MKELLDFFLLMFGVLSLLIYTATLFKNTPLELNLKTPCLWSLLFYKQFFVVSLPILLIQFYGVDHFYALKMAREELSFPIGLYVLYSMLIFISVLKIFLSFIPFSNIYVFRQVEKKNSFNSASVVFVTVGVLVNIIAIVFFNKSHAFFEAVFLGENLKEIRMLNTHYSTFPSQLSLLLDISSYVSAIYSSYLFSKKKKAKSLFTFLLGLFIATTHGSKAPILYQFIIFTLSLLHFKRMKTTFVRLLLAIPVVSVLSLSSIYFISSLQYNNINLSWFFEYLINRIGVGQMSGVYESFSIGSLDGAFYWQMIPFANFFIDFPNYQKELMLFTEGANYTSTGMKNSLFISEAYGIGGFPLFWLSPVIVGFSYGLSLVIFYYVLKKLFGKTFSSVYAIPVFLLSFDITGGFSSFALFKGFILMIITIMTFWIFYMLSKLFIKCPTV